jgi:GH24 family phage-related lysozyme (muramidase)
MDRKIIFDAIRRLLGRGFRQAEVAALDAALDSALRPDNPEPVASPREVSETGVALVKRFEGCARRRDDGSYEAYPDPGTGGAPWTIGWGATGPGIGPGTVWGQAQCDARLAADLARHAAEVARAIGDAPTTQGQFDALVSFHYNTGAIGRATLTRRHRAGDYCGAAGEFRRWNRAGGRVLSGLTRRRAAEAALYRAGRKDSGRAQVGNLLPGPAVLRS